MTNPTITIDDDDTHSIKPEAPPRRSLGGVYNTRSLSRTRSASFQDGRVGEETGDVEDENGEWLREDGKKKQVFKGTALLW